MKTIFSSLGTLIIIAFLIAGCAQSRVEMDYGTSFNLAKYGQTLNPEAWKNIEPVYGMDGKGAQNAVNKYQKGFEKAAPAPTYTFGIGGTGGN